MDLPIIDPDFEFRSAKRNRSAFGTHGMQLLRKAMQGLQGRITSLDSFVGLSVGEPPFDPYRGQCDTIAEPVALLIEPDLNRKSRPRDTSGQAHQIRR